MILKLYRHFQQLIALALVALLSSVPAMAGLTIVGANGITVSGADGATLPFDRGERQLDRLLEVLAVAHPRHPIPLGQALALEGARLARNTVLVVITPSTDLDWPEGLHHLRRRGVRPLAILLDPHSFDERAGGNSRVQDALTATCVPYIPIQRGDPLVHVLEQGPR